VRASGRLGPPVDGRAPGVRRCWPAVLDLEAPAAARGHVIVCGLGGIGVRVVEQLTALGVDAVTIEEDRRDLRAALARAGLQMARAVVCAERTDLATLEAALLVRDLRPDVRVVVHLDNPAVGRAVQDVTGAGSVLDVAGLFAPSVVDACSGRSAHELAIGGEAFVAVEVRAPRLGSLRELYGDLAPIGVVDADDEVLVCPGRDAVVAEGDRVTVLGTEAQVRAAGLLGHEAGVEAAGLAWRHLLNVLARAAQGIAEATDRAVRATLAVGLVLTLASTLVLHAAYRTADGGGMDLLQALYFTMETGATVGFGDFSFAQQSPAMQLFGIALIVSGTLVVSTLFALVTNALVARRIEQSLGRGRLRGIAGHVVVIGLGSVGMRVLEGLVASGRDAVVVERDEDNRYIAQARALGVPVVLGDATLGPTLEAVHLSTAAGVAIMTSDDLVNLETGLAVRDRLGARWEQVPVVLRVFDRALGGRLEGSFGFRHVWSTSAIAAPWFVGSAVGFGVLSTFYVGSVPFLVARLRVLEGGGLAGTAMHELSARIRVIGLERAADGAALEHPPRRDTRFAPGDAAYLVGPYEELLTVVRREGVA
jgi:Trk K+ transport system NAD-binding subunit